MKQIYDWSSVDAGVRSRIDFADKAVAELNKGKDFYTWINIGEGLAQWRQAALELAGTQNVDAQAYRDVKRASASNYPHLAQLPQAEASQAIWMWENREMLSEWHKNLDPTTRRRINHPRTVWNKSPLGKASRSAAQPKLARAKAIKDAGESLAETVEASVEKLEAAGAGRPLILDLSPECLSAAVVTFRELHKDVPDLQVQRFGEALARSFDNARQKSRMPRRKAKLGGGMAITIPPLDD